MKYLSVDRIESGIAVCLTDEGALLQLPLCDVDLTFPVQEGDVLMMTENGMLIPDLAEKERRQKAVLDLLRQVKR